MPRPSRAKTPTVEPPKGSPAPQNRQGVPTHTARPATQYGNRDQHSNEHGRQSEGTRATETGEGSRVSESDAGAQPDGRDWTLLYLDDLEEHGQMAKAAMSAGKTMRVVRHRRKRDPVFAAAEKDAREVAADVVHSEIMRRGIDGVTEETRHRDGTITSRTVYSDTLLLRLAVYNETGSWKERQQVETGAPGAFATRADRKSALERVRREMAEDAAGWKGGENPGVAIPPPPTHGPS